jgi:hypothetical protein
LYPSPDNVSLDPISHFHFKKLPKHKHNVNRIYYYINAHKIVCECSHMYYVCIVVVFMVKKIFNIFFFIFLKHKNYKLTLFQNELNWFKCFYLCWMQLEIFLKMLKLCVYECGAACCVTLSWNENEKEN